MWETIKKWFGFADLNHDGKIDQTDLAVVEAVVKTEIEKVETTVKEVKKRAKRVKQEVADVVETAKAVVDQAEDVVAAAKGKERKGRKKK